MFFFSFAIANNKAKIITRTKLAYNFFYLLLLAHKKYNWELFLKLN